MDNRNKIAKRAARYFKSGDVVNLGIGIPSLCSDYAEEGVLFQAENGVIGMGAVAKGLMANEYYYNAGGIPFVPVAGASAHDVAMAFGVIRSGRMSATVLGALQVSKNGDISNWASPGRVFGMGGAMDLVNGAKKVIVAMEHCTKDGKFKIVDECTFPYTGRNCVDHIVTELCVIDVVPEGLLLREIAKGVTVDEVQAKTGTKLLIAEDLSEMEE